VVCYLLLTCWSGDRVTAPHDFCARWSTRATFARVESVIGLFKTEVLQRRGPWQSLEAVEFATLEWVDWFNTRRSLEPIEYVPPAECEARHNEQTKVA
jgi:transposase InsO family protein